MSNDTTDTKTCTKCGQTFPATAEFFHRGKVYKGGFRTWCKVCVREYGKKYVQVNADKRRAYRQTNADRIRENQRKYQKENLDKKHQYQRKYQRNNVEKERERQRKWMQANPDKGRIFASRYRARKRQLPDTFTPEQWIACLEYHHYCCAVCGTQLRDLFGHVEPQADHWLPLSSDECTGTIATNMICLCNSCNHSKFNKLPDIWLKEKYGTRKANEILKRVDDYFKWVINSS